MCDPITLIAGALGSLGGVAAAKGPKPPAAKLAAPATHDVKEDTGAEVVLGGEREEDEALKTGAAATTTTRKSGSTVRTGKSSGLRIL